MSDSPSAPNLPADDRNLRRETTAKWGARAFVSALVVMALVVIINSWLAPVFYTVINQKPRKVRSRAVSIPWLGLGMTGWSLVIIAMAVVETHGDLVWFVKRTGRLTVALMPPMYLLTLRPSPLPRTFYLQLLPMHKWLSRLVVGFAVVHGAGYVVNYHKLGKVEKLRESQNIAGYAALTLFLMMMITGWLWFRRQSYRVFYGFHIVGAWVALPLTAYHSRPPSTGYLTACALILVLQVLNRIRMTANVKLRVQYVSATLLLVEVPKVKLPAALWKWSPGAHVRLSGTLGRPLTWLQSSHPYTISSLSDEPVLQLVIRRGNFPIKMRQDYALTGPYNSLPAYLESQIKAKEVRRALFIIGGSGIAFGAPLFRYLKLYGVHVKMLWAIRDPYDAKILRALKLSDDMIAGDIEVYYTGERFVEEEDEDEQLEIDISEDCDTSQIQNSPDRQKIYRKVYGDEQLCQYVANMYHSRPHLNLRLRSWLYGLGTDDDDCCCADRLIDVCEEDKLGVWVISTGAPKLVHDARQWAHTSGVNFFEEEFTL